jgi:flotillin
MAMCGILLMLLVTVTVYASRYRRVGPNQVLVLSGRRYYAFDPTTGRREEVGFRIVKGGGVFIWPIVERVDVLSLEVTTVDLEMPKVHARMGVPVTVDGLAQVRVKGDDASIRAAAEQLLSKGRDEIVPIVRERLLHHLRAVSSTVTADEIYQDRNAYAARVQEVAAADMANMGLEIVLFSIRDVYDNQGRERARADK